MFIGGIPVIAVKFVTNVRTYGNESKIILAPNFPIKDSSSSSSLISKYVFCTTRMKNGLLFV